MKFHLEKISFGGMATNDIQFVETSFFSTIVLAKLQDMKTHDLWAAASMLNPGMRDFPIVIYSREQSKTMNGANGLIRRLLVSMGDRASNKILTSPFSRNATF